MENNTQQIKETFINELGLTELPKEKQDEVFERAGAVIFQSVLVRALESMDDDEQKRFDDFIGEHPNDPQALFGYLKENTVDFDQLIASEIARFKATAQEAFQREEDSNVA